MERKKAADKAWDSLYEQLKLGQKINNETIANTMQRCNDVDQQILDYNKSFAEFIKSREVE